MQVSVGNVFMAALLPGLTLSVLYLVFVIIAATVKPSLAPPLPPELLHVPKEELGPLLLRAFAPPVVLIFLIKGCILFGWATPSEAGAVGAVGAMLIALVAGKLKPGVLQSVCHSSGRTIAMIFFVLISARDR